MEKTNQSPLEVIEENAPDTRTYVGGLLMFLPVVPIVATIISIAAYVGSNLKASGTSPGWLDALVGTISTLLLWFLLAFFCRRFTMVRRANEKSYYSLLNHLSTLDYYIDALLSDDTKKATLDMLHNARIKKPGTKFRWLPFVRSSEALPNQPPTPGPSGVPQNQPPSKDISALDPKQEVLYYRNALYLALMQRSASWVVGNGYIELWDLMDSAEEALITFVPPAKVISDAVYDEMRVNNSKIENSEEWTNKLGSAVKKLDTDAVCYLKPSVGTQSLTEGAGIQQQAPQATGKRYRYVTASRGACHPAKSQRDDQ